MKLADDNNSVKRNPTGFMILHDRIRAGDFRGNPTAAAVYAMLALAADKETLECRVNRQTIAASFGLSPATVTRCFEFLTERGMIIRKRHYHRTATTCIVPKTHKSHESNLCDSESKTHKSHSGIGCTSEPPEVAPMQPPYVAPMRPQNIPHVNTPFNTPHVLSEKSLVCDVNVNSVVDKFVASVLSPTDDKERALANAGIKGKNLPLLAGDERISLEQVNEAIQLSRQPHVREREKFIVGTLRRMANGSKSFFGPAATKNKPKNSADVLKRLAAADGRGLTAMQMMEMERTNRQRQDFESGRSKKLVN